MHLGITWNEIALRLACTVIAGTLIGINRGEHGRAAGLRTTLLVCLAASLAMIQANLLLNATGKTSDSFVIMDVMRLPLGILSGMGFIGAGAILRRGNLVLGITTAATLWFVTVMGLCFGGGQIALGLIALALGLIILSGLKWVEDHWTQDRHAILTIVTGTNGPTENEIVEALAAANYKINFSSIVYGENGVVRKFTCQIRWRGRAHETQSPEPIKQLAARFHFLEMDWRIGGHQ
ncbi:MAG TPA: MgtC/SapB family protein [Verrucomicrobiae bacterium]|nr:MgtC/SapB family protein [Verrucomicrobiae bacterium]